MNKGNITIFLQNKDKTWNYKIVNNEQIVESELTFETLEQAIACLIDKNATSENTQIDYYFDRHWNKYSREDCLKAIAYSGSNLKKFPYFWNDCEIFNIAKRSDKSIQDSLDYHHKQVILGMFKK
jgi:phage-related tail protein